MSGYVDKSKLDGERLRLMRVAVRAAYDEAMIDLAKGITGDEIKLA